MATKRERPVLQSDPLAAFPAKLRHSTSNPDVVYVRASGFFARRGVASRALSDAPMMTLEADGDAIHVYRGALPPTPRARSVDTGDDRLLPVYTRDANAGALAIPTGRVFVRFADALKAEAYADKLRALGYRIVRTISYAPNAAWLESTSGASDALKNIDKIESLADVVNVEPQLISPKAAK
jgi:hypothetical protein